MVTALENSGEVAFSGDWHGDTSYALAVLRALAEQGVSRLYHAGDFGLWPAGEKYLTKLDKAACSAGQELYITPGNHDSYSRLARMAKNKAGFLSLPQYPSLLFIPRGHVWFDGQTSFLSLGGATSSDKLTRTKNKDWWEEESITQGDIDSAKKNLEEAGISFVDVMVTHDAPSGLARSKPGARPDWVTDDVVAEMEASRTLIRTLVDSATPRNLVHGHWHELYKDSLRGTSPPGAPYETSVFGLAESRVAGNTMVVSLVPGGSFAAVRFLDV